MLDALEEIAQKLGMKLYYGDNEEFNVEADGHAKWDGPILFHSGYFNLSIGTNLSGSWDDTQNLILYVYVPSNLSDLPKTREPQIDYCAGLARKVLGMLVRELYTLDGRATITGVKNRTDRNLDGVQMVCSLKPVDLIGIC